MTVTAIPPRTARPRLAPYTAASGDMVLPGCYGVSRGQGITGELIRHASGPRPGHAFIYIGNGRIVEVAPPAVRIAPAADGVWVCTYYAGTVAFVDAASVGLEMTPERFRDLIAVGSAIIGQGLG